MEPILSGELIRRVMESHGTELSELNARGKERTHSRIRRRLVVGIIESMAL